MNLIPNYILEISKELEQNNFESHLVGGSVRDILLGKEPKDYDITTNATPDELIKIFPKSIPTGAKFGTVIVLWRDEFGVSQEVEITTFRSEKDYVGGRWPSKVEFSKNIIDDLKRRDFTINSIALNLKFINKENLNNLQEIKKHITDPFSGQDDLSKKIIKAVGNPTERFREDGLRSIRACRLASVLGFTIEKETFEAIKETIEVPALISKERIRDELIKLLENSPKPSIGIELMRESGLLDLILPELLEGYKLEHNKYHLHDVYQHALDTVDIAPKEIRLAALLHDIAKPKCKNGEHFYGHDILGAKMTKEILKRLKFPNHLIEDTSNLVRWHMFFLPDLQKNSSINSDNELIEKKEERKEAFERGWKDPAIRRLIRNVGGHDQVDNLIKLRIADALANPKSSFNPQRGGLAEFQERIAKIREEDSVLSIKDLQITGNDLMEIGFTQGPQIRKVLDYLLEEVTEDIELNEREDLVRLAKNYLRKNSAEL